MGHNSKSHIIKIRIFKTIQHQKVQFTFIETISFKNQQNTNTYLELGVFNMS